MLLALSLGVAACGSDGSSTATGGDTSQAAAAEDASVTESSEAQESSDDDDSSVSDDTESDDTESDDTESDDTESDDTGSDDAAGSGDEAAAVNLFPDVDVLNIADGGVVNLSDELAGGDRPVLLWFWAPH